MLGTEGTFSDAVGNVSINAGTVHIGSDEQFHFLYSLVAFMEVFQGTVEHLRGNADMVLFG